MNIYWYVSLLMCRKHVSSTCRKHACFLQKCWKHACFLQKCWKHACFLQKCWKTSYKSLVCELSFSSFHAMFRKHASHKSARKFPTKCTHELALYVMRRKHASYKSAGISYKMFSWYKFEHYCLYHEHVQELFLHTSANAAQVRTHTVKTWSFLSSARNIIPALQPPNTGALSL